MLLMTFSQKGIDKLREYFEQTQVRYPDGEYEVSEGFDEGRIRFDFVSSVTETVRSPELVQRPVYQVS